MSIQRVTIPVLMTVEVEAESMEDALRKVQSTWEANGPELYIEGQDVLVDFFPRLDKAEADLDTLEIIGMS